MEAKKTMDSVKKSKRMEQSDSADPGALADQSDSADSMALVESPRLDLCKTYGSGY